MSIVECNKELNEFCEVAKNAPYIAIDTEFMRDRTYYAKLCSIQVAYKFKDSKKAKSAQSDLSAIAGQNAVITKAKKSIAGFRVREGMPLGAKATLRGARMYEFLDRLITIAMPRIRDFRGVSAKSFDGRGNYALGIKEHIVFPEIDFDKIDEPWGMDIVITTTASTDSEAKALLTYFNMPFNS